MAVVSVVNFSDVENEQRLDAEYYKPEFLEIEEKIAYIADFTCVVSLRDVCESISHPREFKREYSSKAGTPLIRISNVSEGTFIRKNDLAYIHEKDKKLLVKNKVFDRDILITRSGTVGLPIIVTKDVDGWFVSADFIILRVKKERINPYYLLAYLASKFGKQIIRFSIGGVQRHINTQNLEKVRVIILPDKFQFHIEQLVKQAYEKRKLAEQKYQQAEKLLYELLGISKEEIERLEAEKAYETNFKDVRQSFRFDAEYYHPKYRILKELLERIDCVTLGDTKYFDMSKGTEVGSNTYTTENKGVLFLRVSNLNKEGLKLNPADKRIFRGIYEKLRSKYEPKIREVLFSKDGSVGMAVVVDEDFPPSIVSGGIIRIQIKRVFDPYYISFMLNSFLVELQVNRERTGTVIDHLRFSKVKEIKIPKLLRNDQQEISNLVREAFKLRKESRQLIRQAIEETEETIEHSLKTPI